MFRKTYISVFLASLFFMAAGMTAFAQNAPVRGVVKVQKADGTTAPVADVVVEAYRTDIDKGKMPAAKQISGASLTSSGSRLDRNTSSPSADRESLRRSRLMCGRVWRTSS